MMRGLEHWGHYVVVDNMLAFVNMFHHFMVNGIWTTGIVRRRGKNLPCGLYRESNPKI
jgi:hypothetical protein